MRDLTDIFSKRAVNYSKILSYGFEKIDEFYVYKKRIRNDSFEIKIVISENKKYSELIDIENDMEYALVDIEDATGEFVGMLKQEYENVINDVIGKCTNKEVFKCKQSKEIIEYVRKRYHDELEFLWEKFDDNAIWRNKVNNKWYALILTVPENKIRGNSDKKIEIIDIMFQKEKIDDIVDGVKVYPGYHMNKKSWITVVLDESMDNDELFKLIDNAYNLSVGNKNILDNSLNQRVYDYLLTIPKGKVVTYKQVAEFLGNKDLARVVGNILHKNPDGDKYPCYKVLNSKGELSDNFVFGGKNVQKERLEKDGIKVVDNRVDLNIYQWK